MPEKEEDIASGSRRRLGRFRANRRRLGNYPTHKPAGSVLWHVHEKADPVRLTGRAIGAGKFTPLPHFVCNSRNAIRAFGCAVRDAQSNKRECILYSFLTRLQKPDLAPERLCSENRTELRFFPENASAVEKYVSMRRESKHAVVQRLKYAVAELEVVGEIAKREADPALLEQLYALTERIRDCISGVSNGNTRAVCPNI